MGTTFVGAFCFTDVCYIQKALYLLSILLTVELSALSSVFCIINDIGPVLVFSLISDHVPLETDVFTSYKCKIILLANVVHIQELTSGFPKAWFSYVGKIPDGLGFYCFPTVPDFVE